MYSKETSTTKESLQTWHAKNLMVPDKDTTFEQCDCILKYKALKPDKLSHGEVNLIISAYYNL